MKKATLRATASALALLGAGTAGSFIAAAPAAAQDFTNAQLSGTVTDEGGAPVAGAEIMLVGNQGQSRTTVSDSSGNYRFGNVPQGTYTLTVMQGGEEVYRAEDFRLLGSQNAVGDITLASDPIVITGTGLFINDFEGTTLGLNVDVEELTTRVPLPRDLTSVVLLAPGTTQGDSAFGNLASIGGSSVAENAYYVNGLNITNFDNYLGSARVPFDMYRSVEVKSGGYPAEFGRATGGIVNAVTKSGSNEFFGGIHLDWSPDWGRSTGKDFETCNYDDNTFTTFTCENTTNREADYAQSYSAVLEAGMPVIKDRLFVYGLIEFRESESRTVSRPNSFSTRNIQNDPFWGVKVDAYPIDSQHLEFTIFDTRRQTQQARAPYAETADGFSIGGYSETGRFNFGGVNWVGKYTGNFTDWLTVSAAYGKMEDRFDNVALGAAAAEPPYVNFSGQTVNGVPDGSFVGNQTTTSTTAPYETERKFYRGDVDLYFDVLGEHHIRAGFDVEETTLSRATIYNGGDFLFANNLITSEAYNAGVGGAGIYYIIFPGRRSDGSVGLVQDQIYFNSGGAFDGVNQAFYIQDEWKVNERLTLNLGLRRDDFKLKKADGSTFVELDNNIAPRLGFTYDLWDNEEGKLYGFFGQYYLPVASNTAFRFAGTEFFFRERFDFEGFQTVGGVTVPDFSGNQITDAVDSRYGSPCPFRLNPNAAGGNTCRVTGDGSVPDSQAAFAENLEATKQSEYIIGYEHDFGSFTGGIAYIHRNLDRTAEDAAIDIVVLEYCEEVGIVGCESIWTGFHQYTTYNIGGDLTVLLDGDALCDTDPRACEIVTFAAEDLPYGEATRTYDAVEVTFNRPWDGSWSLGGSYTWSRSYGNTEGYVQSDFGQDDAGITQDFDQPGFVDFAEGRLPNDRTHRIKLFGAYQPLEGLVIGANLSVDSPRPLSCFGFHPTDVFGNLYGAASNFCGLQGIQRGTASETDWVSTLDLSARYNWDMGNDRQIAFTVNAFNVLNSQAVTQRNEFGDRDIATSNADGEPTSVIANPNYDLPSGYQAPRSLRFGIDVTF
ncbi:TonB-dependent receptor [Sphingomicrobium sediminis]|uniref:TonB-dependent receptor n=1 Tax=Sphingomicrobium sediminis TaxID=2950949 RepID=A0A9X2J392_9SPHN|nr:TonB-dependent receptor [Sphingomicrobium sediminis]MCM8557830.1 TonB-dependent receptor [Sphingomicrobium sediminis]